ncbi:kinase-like domain-containing protein [Hygrophoropsis aurantiaca]|uniref:Kinase-like domain-containing protein n=1 Tax=Hygrophoropsis aurantiaca TaxID=72124 RepID=A0ACB8A302_9AGAM|nr:kinase-like domain-containing protein [Hygrophoropsis aurantiaca]
MQNLDTQVIGHYLASYLDDSDPVIQTRKEIFALRGSEAQSIVDLLHTLINHPSLENSLRILFVNGLNRLSERSCCSPRSFVLKGIEIDPKHVTFTTNSDVHMGRARGQQLVAVKKIRLVGKEEIEPVLKDWAREAIIWSQLSHPNLLPFYGIFYVDEEKSRIALVSPWMEHGDLSQYLKNVPNANCEFLAMDISLGIEYLHTSIPKVTHGDLKPNNIFVTSSRTACIGDFGHAYSKDSQRKPLTSTRGPSYGGTWIYQSPEIFKDKPVSVEGDIYAFGMILYEIFSKQQPFQGLKDMEIMDTVKNGGRPGRPKHGITDALWALIQRCWTHDANERPAIDFIVQQLSSPIPQSERVSHIWDDSVRHQLRETYTLLEHPTTFRSK